MNQEQKTIITNQIRNETLMDQSVWSNRLMALGRPSILEKLNSGITTIWLTELTIAEKQRSGKFPKLFHGNIFPEIAGITIKKVDRQDRPGLCSNDMCLDIIITFAINCYDHLPNPIFHREQLPDWTVQQRQIFGRHTTGPLFTHWHKI